MLQNEFEYLNFFMAKISQYKLVLSVNFLNKW